MQKYHITGILVNILNCNIALHSLSDLRELLCLCSHDSSDVPTLSIGYFIRVSSVSSFQNLILSSCKQGQCVFSAWGGSCSVALKSRLICLI